MQSTHHTNTYTYMLIHRFTSCVNHFSLFSFPFLLVIQHHITSHHFTSASLISSQRHARRQLPHLVVCAVHLPVCPLLSSPPPHSLHSNSIRLCPLLFPVFPVFRAPLLSSQLIDSVRCSAPLQCELFGVRVHYLYELSSRRSAVEAQHLNGTAGVCASV